MREISTVRSESMRLIENACVSREMRETTVVRLGRSADGLYVHAMSLSY